MAITAGAPVPEKPDMQSQADGSLPIRGDAPQVQSSENAPPTLSPQELDRIFPS